MRPNAARNAENGALHNNNKTKNRKRKNDETKKRENNMI